METSDFTPSSLGYFVFSATDLDAWKTFAVDIIGLQQGDDSDDQTLLLRMDEQTRRLAIEQGDKDDLLAVGWELANEEALEQLVGHMRRQGESIEMGDGELCRKRGVEKLYCCEDPNGLSHELYFGPANAPVEESFRSNVLSGSFIADRLGAGHFLAVAKDFEATKKFYRETLCLRLSDVISAELAPGGPMLDAIFLHAKTGRHHSAALAVMPSKQKLHHIMLQCDNMMDVGMAYERCKNAGLKFMMELGQHPNDKMFSFYVKTPGGFGLEFGWGGIVVDDLNWEVKSYSRLSDWGHHPPAA